MEYCKNMENEENKTEEKPVMAGERQESIRNPDGTFKKGFSGNPAGAPHGYKKLTTLLTEALAKIANDKGETFDELLVKRVIKNAIDKGDMRAIEHIWDRREGKAVQFIDMKAQVDTLTDEQKANLRKLLDD